MFRCEAETVSLHYQTIIFHVGISVWLCSWAPWHRKINEDFHASKNTLLSFSAGNQESVPRVLLQGGEISRESQPEQIQRCQSMWVDICVTGPTVYARQFPTVPQIKCPLSRRLQSTTAGWSWRTQRMTTSTQAWCWWRRPREVTYWPRQDFLLRKNPE